MPAYGAGAPPYDLRALDSQLGDIPATNHYRDVVGATSATWAYQR